VRSGSRLAHDVGPNQFGALVSYAYNVGMGNFRSSQVLALVNAGDLRDVPEALRAATSNSRLLGLQRRRQAEAALWSQEER